MSDLVKCRVQSSECKVKTIPTSPVFTLHSALCALHLPSTLRSTKEVTP